jgi:hypothetical protein
MTRLRPFGFLLISGLVLALTATGAGYDEPAEREGPALPAAGTSCRVELKPEKDDKGRVIEVVYEGTVSESKDDGITLTVRSARRTESTGGLASKLPILNRLFRNIGIARSKPGEEKSIWIPEAAILAVKELDEV